ncbi:MAG: hypothetical protein Aurels2KO_49530 [Aureliella sp.]
MLSLAARPLLLGLFAALAVAGSTANAADNLLGFRMRNFKSLHMHDEAEANKMIETLKTLRCEVKVSQHGDHKDVAFRTQQWKLLSLKSADQVAGWQKWLKANGFETLRSNPVAKEKPAAQEGSAHVEVVQYRAVETKTLHVHQPAEAAEALAIFRALGCEAKQVSHGNHKDLQVTCKQWREIVLPNHETAGSWETYLKTRGFETKHEHRH